MEDSASLLQLEVGGGGKPSLGISQALGSGWYKCGPCTPGMILHSQPCSILLCWVLCATSISAKKGACLNWVHFTSTCWDEKLLRAQAEESRLASQPHMCTQVLSYARKECPVSSSIMCSKLWGRKGFKKRGSEETCMLPWSLL